MLEAREAQASLWKGYSVLRRAALIVTKEALVAGSEALVANRGVHGGYRVIARGALLDLKVSLRGHRGALAASSSEKLAERKGEVGTSLACALH